MRIAMVTHKPCVNDSRIERETRSLLSKGHDVCIFAATRDPLSHETPANVLPMIRLSLPRRPWEHGVGKIFLLLRYAWKLLVALRSFRPAVIHCHDIGPLIPCYLLGRLLGARVVYDSHELWEGYIDQAPMPRSLRILAITAERAVVRRVDAVIVVSDSIADRVANRMKISRPLVLRNIPEVQASMSRALVLAEVIPELKGSHLTVIYHGMVAIGRGIGVLIEEMERLRGKGIHLVVIGDGPDLDRMRHHVETKGLNPIVHFLAPVPSASLLATIAQADIGSALTLPLSWSYEFSLPNRLFECLAAGLPVIASDLTEIGALIRKHKVGILVPPGSVSSLVASLEGVVADPKHRFDLRQAVQVAVTGSLNWHSEEKILIGLYDRFESLDRGDQEASRSI